MVGDIGGLVVKVNVIMSYTMTNECIQKEAILKIVYRKYEGWRENGAFAFVCVKSATKVVPLLANRQ